MSFSTGDRHQSRQYPSWLPWLLPPLFPLLIHAPRGCLAGRGRRCRAVPSSPASAASAAAPATAVRRAQQESLQSSTAQATRKLRVAVLFSEAIAGPSSRTGTRERALCRRWTPVSHPDALASSRPNWTKSTLRMEPAVQSAVADIFKSPD